LGYRRLGAVGASLPTKSQALATSRDGKAVERSSGIGGRQGKGAILGWQEAEDVVLALIHVLGVACTIAVREGFSIGDWTEELIVVADVLG